MAGNILKRSGHLPRPNGGSNWGHDTCKKRVVDMILEVLHVLLLYYVGI